MIDGIDQALEQQRGRHRECERDLAEGLPVHGRGLVAVERQPGQAAADQAADQARSTASTSTDMTTGTLPKPSARSVAISRVRAATAEYIVLTAPKIAPSPISAAMANPIVRMIACSTCDCCA